MVDADTLIQTPRPLPNAGDARRKADADLLGAMAKYGARLFTVAAVTGSIVSLTSLTGDDAGDAARLGGTQYGVGDLVLAIPVVGDAGDLEWVVVDRLDPDPAPTPYDPRLPVQTYAGFEQTANGVTNSTNTSLSTFLEAQHLDFTLPAGTWTVRVAVSLGATHSSGGTVYAAPYLDGVQLSSGGKGNACGSTTPTRIENTGTATGVAAGAHTAMAGYHPNTSGTATAFSPRILVDAWRTA